jgi:hypothetical protein
MDADIATITNTNQATEMAILLVARLQLLQDNLGLGGVEIEEAADAKESLSEWLLVADNAVGALPGDELLAAEANQELGKEDGARVRDALQVLAETCSRLAAMDTPEL